MKLYTEEQLIQAFKSGMNACMKHKDWALAINYPNKIELLEFMQSLTPIEIPSDEEIEDESGKYYDNNAAKAHDYYFELGAKWMRDKIQGGNK
jgi:hypothetical protein